jgi:hypothetical protein
VTCRSAQLKRLELPRLAQVMLRSLPALRDHERPQLSIMRKFTAANRRKRATAADHPQVVSRDSTVFRYSACSYSLCKPSNTGRCEHGTTP